MNINHEKALQKRFRKERGIIEELCRKNGLSYRQGGNKIFIKSPLGDWVILMQGKCEMFLYHKNTPKAKDQEGSRLNGYHSHYFKGENLSDYFGKVANHDNWRMENEIIHEFKPIENNYHKGSKDWKKIERKNRV